MATILVDGREYEVRAGDNLLHACLSHGLDVPYFCWHPAMGSVGACRQCAIKQFKDESDTKGMLAMACMTAVQDGARISVEDEEARAFRAGVIEFLMANHPHDCPVCEEGGECHLQDMTLMTGHVYRRHRFKKRTFRNQDLGPCIGHEMNRCITCYRCVRFYRDYAGGRDLHALGAHDHVYFGRHEDGTLESEFSGNLAEVCPTGVFTDKPFAARYTRKWDLRSTPSVCMHCSLGCNTSPNERYGEVRRVVNRYNGAVNGYFLCDRGRFGFDFVNREDRLTRPHVRQDGAIEPADGERALSRFAERIREGRAIGFGSPRASLEANFALWTLVGEDRFFAAVAPAEDRIVRAIRDVLRDGPVRTPSLREVEDADAVLVLGEDVPNTAPRLALGIRQAARNKAFAEAESKDIPRWQDASVRDAAPDVLSPVFIATPDATRIDDLAAATLRAAPADIARLGFALAHELDGDAPDADVADDVGALARRIADALRAAERPLIVSGAGSGSLAVVEAAANVARALHRRGRAVGLTYALPECDSMGLALLDPQPLDAAADAVRADDVDTVIVLENDLYRRAPKAFVDALLDQAREVVVLDCLHHATVDRATIALPAGTFAEAEGTLVSAEGRAQRFFRLLARNDHEVRASWEWLRDAMVAAGRNEAVGWRRLDDLVAACAAALPGLEGIRHAAPGADFRIAGMRIPREPHRYSGRTAMHADRTVHEPKPPEDANAPLSFTMEGYPGRPPAALAPFFWAPRWNSNEALNKFQDEIGGPLAGGDPGVRLIEPGSGPAPYFRDVPAAFAPRDDAWLAVPAHHVFASEELSARSPPVAARAPARYVAVNPAGARRLGLEEGADVTLALDRDSLRLRLRVRPDLPDGIATVLVGAPGVPMLPLPGWARIEEGG